MKQNLHPKSNKDVKVTCACGNIIETMSTLGKDFNVEICAACHPFFTGKQRIVDSAGRVERFQKKYANFNKQSDSKKAAK